MEGNLRALLSAHRRISAVGMSKNAGKTTALNAMLRASAGTALALSSIGRDGERTDVVTGTEKPGVFVHAGTLFATAEQLIPLCTATRTVLALTDFTTPLGRVALLRADSDGAVQLAGPSTVEQTRAVCALLSTFGAERILLDGALFRRSIANPALCDAVTLSVGAAYHGDMARVVSDAAFCCALMTLPLSEPDAEALPGALTDAAAQALLQTSPRPLTISDPSRALLGRAAFERLLARGFTLSVRERPALLCAFVNPYSPYGAGFDREKFRDALTQKLPVPVLDAKEML